MYVDTPAMEHMWSSMNNLLESVLSLYHVGLRDWAQVLGLMTSTVTHPTISLALPTKILCNRRALYYNMNLQHYDILTDCIFITLVSCVLLVHTESTVSNLCSMVCEKAHCPSQKSIQWQLGRFC